MTGAEIAALYRSAEAEFDKGEEAMLITPIALMGLVEALQRCERQRAESGAYDQLAD